MKRLLMLLYVIGLIPNPLFAQEHHNGDGHHGLWPDTLETMIISGKAIIDSTKLIPMYYLDIDNDSQAEYILSFGPSWYEPVSGAVLPYNGDAVIVFGTKWGYDQEFPIIVVCEINGLKWRDSIEGGMHGWDGDQFWSDSHIDTTVMGTLLVDSSYFYVHFFWTRTMISVLILD